MTFPEELKYTRTHEWIRFEDETTAYIGITDYAQDQLGDLVFANLPEEGDELTAGAAFADVESVKAVSDVLSPVSGTVAEINEALADVEPTKFPKKDPPPFTPVNDDSLAISSTGYNSVDNAYSAFTYDYTYTGQSSQLSRSSRDEDAEPVDEDGDGYDDITGEELEDHEDDEDEEDEEEEDDSDEE